MNLSLEGRNAFVGGGSKGIGLASAQELALLGANVTLVSRSEEDLKAAIQTLDTSLNQNHDFLVADYADLDALQVTVEQQLSKVGAYHILINNTGGPAAGPIKEATQAAFLSAFNNHLLANHLLVQTFLSGMQAANYGRVINVISTSVKIPLTGLGVSNTIRGSVASWAKTMANELGPIGITVNNVLPGATATGRLDAIIKNKASKASKEEAAVAEQMKSIIPMKRFGEPNEIGGLVAFLASPAAAYITGTSTPVDGGRTGAF